MIDKLQQEKNLQHLYSCLHDNFWVAYDALEPKNNSLLMKGIGLSKEMQQAVIRVGSSIIEKKEVKMAEYFRYVMLENDYLSDIKLFQYPLALMKLGMFIMDDYKELKQKSQVKPLLMAIKNTKMGSTLVLAVYGQQLQDSKK